MSDKYSVWPTSLEEAARANKARTPMKEIPPAHNHKLAHNPFTSRWSCACGYVLGDGREKLLAPCPLTIKKKPKRGKEKQHEKPQRSKSANAKHSKGNRKRVTR